MEIFYELEIEEESPFGKNKVDDLNVLLATAKKTLNDYDEARLKKAFEYCWESHKNVKRKSGIPFYTHPLSVSIILMNYFPYHDMDSVIACLLHDVVEDVELVSLDEISVLFGNEVANIIDGVTKISHKNTSKEANKASTYRKLFLALIGDFRVILIKLADRLHNMRTLHYMTSDKQNEIALETLNFYTPFAHRLGLARVKAELENLSFYFSDKSSYEAIRNALNIKRREFISYIKIFLGQIEESLKNAGIEFTFTIVHKHEYEIYSMIQNGTPLDSIENFYSIVVVLKTDDESQCFRAYGIITKVFHTIEYKDNLNAPDINWYRSLNLQVVGLDGKKIEILIRTEEMERVAEEGFASAFSETNFKQNQVSTEIDDEYKEKWGDWMQKMIEEREEDSIRLIWDSIKVNMFDSKIIVYSNDGKSYNLPKRSTILDLAYEIDSEIGLHFVSAKINGSIKDVNYTLNTGDKVEFITSPAAKPRAEWRNYVVTYKATVALYKYFLENDYDSSLMFTTTFQREIGLKIIGEDKEGMMKKITLAVGEISMKKLNVNTYEKFFVAEITLSILSDFELNDIFVKIFTIPGIKSVEKIMPDASVLALN